MPKKHKRQRKDWDSLSRWGQAKRLKEVDDKSSSSDDDQDPVQQSNTQSPSVSFPSLSSYPVPSVSSASSPASPVKVDNLESHVIAPESSEGSFVAGPNPGPNPDFISNSESFDEQGESGDPMFGDDDSASDGETAFFSDSDIEIDDSDPGNISISIINSVHEPPNLDDDSTLNESEEQQPEDASTVLQNFLQKWSNRTNCYLSHLSSLAKGLKEIHPQCFSNLNVNANTIKGTPPKKTDVRPIPNGHYAHIGLPKQLLFILTLLSTPVIVLDLLFNIDGLPLYKNSNHALWPITMSLPCVPGLKGKVFPIGLWYGHDKPKSNEAFLQEFIDELVKVLLEGFTHEGRCIQIRLLGFTCDMPAKSYLLGIIGSNGFFSCTRCKVEGISIGKRRVFLDLNCPHRTDAEFRNRADKKFRPRNRSTPLLRIKEFCFVSMVVIDYMHLICIGTLKTLLKTLVAVALAPHTRALISDALVRFRQYIPKEFARRPRELSMLKRWKATESRMFLLYLGVVVLNGVLEAEQFQHFLYLHVAVTILLDPVYCGMQESRNYARNLLRTFVADTPQLYTEILVTANFHNLIHITDDADYFSTKIPNFTLDDISCFPFENYLQELKSLVHGYNLPLQQLVRRISELFCSGVLEEKYKDEISAEPHFVDAHNDGPLPSTCRSPQYRKYVFPNFELTVQSPNNYCIVENGDIVFIENFAYSKDQKCQVIVGRKYEQQTDLYGDGETLCRSSSLGIFKVKKLSSSYETWPCSSVRRKGFVLPLQDDWFAFFSLRHS